MGREVGIESICVYRVTMEQGGALAESNEKEVKVRKRNYRKRIKREGRKKTNVSTRGVDIHLDFRANPNEI